MLQFSSNLWYYNKNIKSMLIGFLNIFPQMKIHRFNSSTGVDEQEISVPIMFGPIERSSYINSLGQTVQRTVQLPLLQFELTGMEMDKTRAFAMKSLHITGARSGAQIDNLMPFPYNFTITMNIYAKYQEDLMQLIEQIAPLFNYHRNYLTKHPIFPEEITLSHWVSITSPPNFSFNYEYSAADRRDILAVPITFTIESWLVRESYSGYGMVKEIINNFYDYTTSAGLSKLRMVADPTVREVIYTPTGLFTPAAGQLISGSAYSGTIVAIISTTKFIVKFNTEIEVFLKDEAIRVGLSPVGVTISCEPYDPFMDADYGWSGYSGYSGYSEAKTDGISGVL
jgi:hypothetical protein